MKKEWKKPELEVLEVSMTMLGKTGNLLDNDFPTGTPFSHLTFS